MDNTETLAPAGIDILELSKKTLTRLVQMNNEKEAGEPDRANISLS